MPLVEVAVDAVAVELLVALVPLLRRLLAAPAARAPLLLESLPFLLAALRLRRVAADVAVPAVEVAQVVDAALPRTRVHNQPQLAC